MNLFFFFIKNIDPPSNTAHLDNLVNPIAVKGHEIFIKFSGLNPERSRMGVYRFRTCEGVSYRGGMLIPRTKKIASLKA